MALTLGGLGALRKEGKGDGENQQCRQHNSLERRHGGCLTWVRMGGRGVLWAMVAAS